MILLAERVVLVWSGYRACQAFAGSYVTRPAASISSFASVGGPMFGEFQFCFSKSEINFRGRTMWTARGGAGPHPDRAAAEHELARRREHSRSSEELQVLVQVLYCCDTAERYLRLAERTRRNTEVER